MTSVDCPTWCCGEPHEAVALSPDVLAMRCPRGYSGPPERGAIPMLVGIADDALFAEVAAVVRERSGADV